MLGFMKTLLNNFIYEALEYSRPFQIYLVATLGWQLVSWYCGLTLLHWIYNFNLVRSQIHTQIPTK